MEHVGRDFLERWTDGRDSKEFGGPDDRAPSMGVWNASGGFAVGSPTFGTSDGIAPLLESPIDAAQLVTTGEGENWVLSQDGTTLYVAGDDGFLRAYDSGSGNLLGQWKVGKNLDAIDLSSDGRYLAITEGEPVSYKPANPWWDTKTKVAVYLFDLESNTAETFIYRADEQDYVFGDVAFAGDGTLLMTERILPSWSGWGELVRLDIATGEFSANGTRYYAGGTSSSSLVASKTNDTVLLGQLNLSSGQYYLLDANGLELGDNGTYDNGVYGGAGGVEAFAGEGKSGRIAIQTGGETHLYDGQFNYLTNLSNRYEGLLGSPGLAYSADGRILYAIDAANDAILGIRMSDLTIATVTQLADLDYQVLQWGEELALSPDEGFFYVSTTDGIVRVAFVNDMTGTEDAETITGGGRIDHIEALGGDDLVKARGGDDLVHGGEGNDRLVGQSGDDELHGDVGDDFAKGGSGADSVYGGEGRDTLKGNAGDDVLFGGADKDKLFGHSGNDFLWGEAGNDRLVGSAGRDVLNGGDGDDTLKGGAGRDRLYGDADHDRLIGHEGDDKLVGGEGNDTLLGGEGDDFLRGNDGADIFVFRGDFGIDEVGDFEIGLDTLKLKDMRDANGGEALTFDQLLITQQGADAWIELDLNRDGVADVIDGDGDGVGDQVRIELLEFDATTLTAADFQF